MAPTFRPLVSYFSVIRVRNWRVSINPKSAQWVRVVHVEEEDSSGSFTGCGVRVVYPYIWDNETQYPRPPPLIPELQTCFAIVTCLAWDLGGLCT